MEDPASGSVAFKYGRLVGHYGRLAMGWLRRSSTVLGVPASVGLALLVIVLLIYVDALVSSKAGEVAGALGSVVGGMIGAGGAVWAVYLALARQRVEEADKVASSIRTEVATFTKYVIGGMDVCINIQKGRVAVPRVQANYIAKNFSIDPVVYPAVADRVGLLPHPQATVGFYMRIAEAKAALEVLAKAPPSEPPGVGNRRIDMMTRENALAVADCLATALQLAAPIISDVAHPAHRDQLDTMSRQETLRQIEQCLAAAHLAFPEAESFSQPSPAAP